MPKSADTGGNRVSFADRVCKLTSLQYFGEAFTKEQCQANCDNCCSSEEYESVDMTQEAKDIINTGTLLAQYTDINTKMKFPLQ